MGCVLCVCGICVHAHMWMCVFMCMHVHMPICVHLEARGGCQGFSSIALHLSLETGSVTAAELTFD